MFNLFKKKQTRPTISNLEKRICDLENPYKYEIGDKGNIGIIVDRDYEYEDISIELQVMFGHNTKFQSEYRRVNLYDIYIEDFKKTQKIKESELNQNK